MPNILHSYIFYASNKENKITIIDFTESYNFYFYKIDIILSVDY